MTDVITLLRQWGIQPTPQRIAVVEVVLDNGSHPTAEDVFADTSKKCPTVSRATVYNTLNLLVDKGLLKSQILKEGTVVFDPEVKKHHHFIDDETGTIYDIPWEALSVAGKEELADFDIREYQVVMRGCRKRPT